MDNSYSTKIKNFCSSKDTIMKTKRQTLDGEKIFTRHLSDKGLVSRIYKKPSKIQQ